MKRFITQKLIFWRDRKNRKPLLLRGARQVGKTWVVSNFGKKHFPGRFHLIDLEKNADWHQIFERNLDVKRIVSELEILTNARITPGRDLLFIDEIQSCPRALMALRYFYEDMPELHIIAAGSLLEFALRDISFPVGRVQNMAMYPLCFAEFLLAAGKTVAAQSILAPPEKLPDAVHNMLLGELRRYLFIGGMPECVNAALENDKVRDAFVVQADLLHTFRQDFGKYAAFSNRRCLDAVLTSTAQNIGKQIKYARLAEGFTNPTIKRAFDLLTLAQLIRKIPAASPAGLPLGASASEKKFKSLMLDVGLVQSLCKLPLESEFLRSDLLNIYQGALAEQFVGQEFLATEQELFYWAREAKSSSAEVDYLIVKNGSIVPVEVKSGASGRLRSLHMVMQNYPDCPGGYIFSSAPYAQLSQKKLTFLPLYYAFQQVAGGTVSIDF